jgi:hypothetical protein
MVALAARSTTCFGHAASRAACRSTANTSNITTARDE